MTNSLMRAMAPVWKRPQCTCSASGFTAAAMVCQPHFRMLRRRATGGVPEKAADMMPAAAANGCLARGWRSANRKVPRGQGSSADLRFTFRRKAEAAGQQNAA